MASIQRKGAVDIKEKRWIIPPEASKNGKPHLLHLSDFALAVWDRLLTLRVTESDYLFPGKQGGHISEKEVTRRLTDRQTRTKPLRGRKNSTDLNLPGGHWTQHDLRRTAATMMGELGFTQDVIDRCLNHKEPKKVTRTYQRQTMLSQRQAAFESLGNHLTRLPGDPKIGLPDAPLQ